MKIQDLNSALGVMQQMTDAGVQPTLSTYQSIIELCVAVSDLERATAVISPHFFFFFCAHSLHV